MNRSNKTWWGLWAMCGIAAVAGAQTDLYVQGPVPVVDGWNFESEITGNDCGDPCNQCNDGNETYAVNPFPQTPITLEVAPLTATNFADMPAGLSCVASVAFEVMCRYNDNDSGRIVLRVFGGGFDTGEVTVIVPESGTQCRYIAMPAANLAGLNNASPALINQLQASVRRFRDGSANTNLRVKQMRLRVTPGVAPVAPTGISAQRASVCAADTGSNLLTVQGGSGAMVEWFRDMCGSAVIATGPTFNVNPARPGAYLARWTNACGATACASIVIGSLPQPVAPTGASSSATAVCTGSPPFTVSALGGSGDVLRWYEGGCGVGALIGTGSPLTISPARPGVFCARWESNSGCAPSACACVTVAAQGGINPTLVATPGTLICEGRDFDVSVVIAPPGQFTYQWFKNGVALSNGFTPCLSFIVGATGPLLRVQNSCAADSGVYNVRVTGGPCGMEMGSNPIDIWVSATARTCCDTIDFNRDQVVPDINDFEAFLSVFGGMSCPQCGDLDFNNDGISPDSRDIEAFLSALGGGDCLR